MLIITFNNILLSLSIVLIYQFILIGFFFNILNLIYLLLKLVFLYYIIEKYICLFFYYKYNLYLSGSYL